FNRRFIEENQLSFDENCNIGEDGIFLSKALPLANRISSVPALFYAYRRHSGSMMGNNWSLEQFLEEERASRIISENLDDLPSVRFSYIYQRYTDYWVNKLLPRVVVELSTADRAIIFDNYRKSLIDYESSLQSQIRGGVKLSIYRFFLREKYYRSLERFVLGLHRLTPFPYLNLGYYLYLFGSVRQLMASIVRRTRRGLRQRIKLRTAVSMLLGPSSIPQARYFDNSEGLEEYNFVLDSEGKKLGTTALIRVKNEELNIADCIASVMPCVDEILVIDNGSTDTTVARVQAMLQSQKGEKPVRLMSYPFLVARCGVEHRETHEHSVHNLAYYYNWCLSHCRTTHVIKWDADMRVINDISAQLGFRHFLEHLRVTRARTLGSFPVQTIYLDKSGQAFTTADDIHSELRYFPNTPDIYFVKGDSWEYLLHPRFQQIERSEEIFCYEIKDTRQEEFSHWSATSFDGWRKALEYRNYRLVSENLHMREGNFVPVQPHRLSMYRAE
ncbi:MAG: hypothetical protein GY922_13270, partial [Proteobacteria bacterium]|nr:hypothetical protein [Pseudomonadota bacterium]